MTDLNRTFKESETTGIPHKPAALVIGLTSCDGMSREDATNFTNAMAQSLKSLRTSAIPVYWAAIAPSPNRLILPADPTNTSQYSIEELIELNFDEDMGNGELRDIHYKFLENHGPRRNEVVYLKPTKDTLLDPSDVEFFGPSYRNELLAQSGVKLASEWSPSDHELMRYIEASQADEAFAKLFADPSLAEHMIIQGHTDIGVMGAVGHHCCTETLIGGAVKGFQMSLISDRVLSWGKPITTPQERETAPFVWKNPSHPVNHAFLAQDRVRIILENDPGQRKFTADQKADIAAIEYLNCDEWIQKRQPSSHSRIQPNIG